MKKQADPIETALTAAIDNVRAVLSARAKIKSAIAETEAAIPASEAAVQVALTQMAALQADAALAGSDTTVGAQPVAEARAKVEMLRARLQGLHRKLIETEDGVLAVEAALTGPRKEYMEAVVAQYTREYMEAVQVFAATVRRLQAVGNALPGQRFHALTELNLPMPSDSTRQAVRFDKPAEGHSAGSRVATWRSDPQALAAASAVVPLKEVMAELEGETKAIRQRQGRETPAPAPSKEAKGSLHTDGPLPYFTRIS